jgi:hypothetical protein
MDDPQRDDEGYKSGTDNVVSIDTTPGFIFAGCRRRRIARWRFDRIALGKFDRFDIRLFRQVFERRQVGSRRSR